MGISLDVWDRRNGKRLKSAGESISIDSVKSSHNRVFRGRLHAIDARNKWSASGQPKTRMRHIIREESLRGLLLFCFVTIGLGLASAPGLASCLSLKKGPVVYDVQGCGEVKPEQTFDLSREKFKWIGDMDTAGQKKLLDSYRGLLLKGIVVKSEARDSGLTGDSGVLEGDTVRMYMLPSGNSCKNVAGKRLQGVLKERCCDGGGDVPCLLNTSFVLTGVQSLGKANSADGDARRERAMKSKPYKAGIKAYKQRQWKKARSGFESARSNGSIDLRGEYLLAATYRELEKCRKSIPILETIYKRHVNKQIWGDEIPWARKAVFLLARCYAKINDPSRSAVILEAYLLEPKKYRRELRMSLGHKDFGWIHTSKEYRVYKAAAQKKLRASR